MSTHNTIIADLTEEVESLRKQRDELLEVMYRVEEDLIVGKYDDLTLADYIGKAIASVKCKTSDESDTDGGSRAGYECPVCRHSDCLGCAKGGA